jgi:hypothetical protein
MAYWHLATRPNELQAMREPALKEAAAAIDARLNAASSSPMPYNDTGLR